MTSLRRILASVILSLGVLGAGAASAADNYQVKNAAGTNITIRAKEIGTSGSGLYAPLFVPSDASGNPLGVSGAPFFVTLSGTSSVTVSNFPSTQAVTVGNFPATQPVSATALPLPTGAATEATIAARLPTLGAKASAGSLPVVLPTDQVVVAAPAPSSAIVVTKTGSIGTTGVQVSAADLVNRRTVTNTGSIACELMGSAAAFGTGFPLPAGESFTFDAAGRTTAALFVACSTTGGTVAVISY